MSSNTEISPTQNLRFAVVGPSGCGKSAVGKALSDEIHGIFLDADDFHTPENKERMRAGKGLTDELRRPWLARIRAAAEQESEKAVVVLACSGLKHDLRQQLSHGDPGWKFIALDVDAATLMERLTTRKGHFFPASLLESQLTSWEPLTTEEGFAVDGTRSIAEIVQTIRDRMNL